LINNFLYGNHVLSLRFLLPSTDGSFCASLLTVLVERGLLIPGVYKISQSCLVGSLRPIIGVLARPNVRMLRLAVICLISGNPLFPALRPLSLASRRSFFSLHRFLRGYPWNFITSRKNSLSPPRFFSCTCPSLFQKLVVASARGQDSEGFSLGPLDVELFRCDQLLQLYRRFGISGF